MTLHARVHLSKRHQLVDREIPPFGESRVQNGNAVSLRENEAVPIGPAWIVWIVLQHTAEIECGDDLRGRQRAARVTAVRGRDGPESVGAQRSRDGLELLDGRRRGRGHAGSGRRKGPTRGKILRRGEGCDLGGNGKD